MELEYIIMIHCSGGPLMDRMALHFGANGLVTALSTDNNNCFQDIKLDY